MLKSRIPALTAASFTIASAIALTGMGARALAAPAVPRAQAATSHVYITATRPAVARHTANRILLACPGPAVCIYQGANLSGFWQDFPTQTYKEKWTNLVPFGFQLPWGSYYNNSGSSVVFGDAQTNTGACYYPGTAESNPSAIHDRYMWIEFGNTQCNGHVGDLPGNNTPPAIHLGS